jgi:hypothetical protein
MIQLGRIQRLARIKQLKSDAPIRHRALILGRKILVTLWLLPGAGANSLSPGSRAVQPDGSQRLSQNQNKPKRCANGRRAAILGRKILYNSGIAGAGTDSLCHLVLTGPEHCNGSRRLGQALMS